MTLQGRLNAFGSGADGGAGGGEAAAATGGGAPSMASTSLPGQRTVRPATEPPRRLRELILITYPLPPPRLSDEGPASGGTSASKPLPGEPHTLPAHPEPASI